MIEIKRYTDWKADYVGMIYYSSYWHTYSLVLAVDVDTQTVTELDSFGEINHGTEHKIRTHGTSLSYGDRFYTVEEFTKAFNDLIK